MCLFILWRLPSFSSANQSDENGKILFSFVLVVDIFNQSCFSLFCVVSCPCNGKDGRILIGKSQPNWKGENMV